MNQLVQLFQAHEVWGTLALTTLWTAFVGSLDAPTKDSGPFYVFVFKFCNSLAGNFKRAQSTAIENSPNFQAAVQAQMQARTVVMDGQLLPDQEKK